MPARFLLGVPLGRALEGARAEPHLEPESTRESANEQPVDATKPWPGSIATARHMVTMEPITLYCDESGHTGPRLLDPAQRIFSFATVAIGDDEAFAILQEARREHPVQMPELKAGALLKSGRGLALVEHVLRRADGRYKAVAYDKVLALAGKFFEYVYEPVLQRDPGIVYAKNLHRFVAMYSYLFFTEGDERGEQALREFERYMRSLDPADAPFIFDPPAVRPDEANDPFAMIPTFSRACRAAIVADNRDMEAEMADRGKWVLDLAVASLWSLLDDWDNQRARGRIPDAAGRGEAAGVTASRGGRRAARPDPLTPEHRRRNMSRIRGRDTKPELLLRRALHAAGVRYRLHDRSLPGTPDLVMAGRRAVLFVHGCFWHAHDCPYGVTPASNRAFWEEKLARNVARDREQLDSLRNVGWRTGVVWGSAR